MHRETDRRRRGNRRALVPWLAARILDHLREQAAQPGTHITEQGLADRFQVSRTPVRMALAQLASASAVEPRPNRGFYVSTAPASIPASDLPDVDEDALYYRIAEDRLARRVNER